MLVAFYSCGGGFAFAHSLCLAACDCIRGLPRATCAILRMHSLMMRALDEVSRRAGTRQAARNILFSDTRVVAARYSFRCSGRSR